MSAAGLFSVIVVPKFGISSVFTGIGYIPSYWHMPFALVLAYATLSLQPSFKDFVSRNLAGRSQNVVEKS